MQFLGIGGPITLCTHCGAMPDACHGVVPPAGTLAPCPLRSRPSHCCLCIFLPAGTGGGRGHRSSKWSPWHGAAQSIAPGCRRFLPLKEKIYTFSHGEPKARIHTDCTEVVAHVYISSSLVCVRPTGAAQRMRGPYSLV